MGFASGVFVGFIAGAVAWQIFFVRYRNRQIRELQDLLEAEFNAYVERVILPSIEKPPEAAS